MSRRGEVGLGSLVGIALQITTNLVFNPDTSFVTDGGGSGKDAALLEIALTKSEPHLAEIKLAPEFYGRRLKLLGTWMGHQQTEQLKEGSLELELAESCGWVWDFGRYVFIAERPVEINYIENERFEFRLHSNNRPAIRWSDNFSIYAINGILVPEFVVMRPQRITRYAITNETNQEVRRIMIDRYKLREPISGIAAYLLDSHAKKIDHDERFGTLHFLPQQLDENIAMLEVVNCTPEPDGSFKHYFLRVPPTIRKSREAAAWTFGMTADEYDPKQET